MAIINDLRRSYHERICTDVIYLKNDNIPNMADKCNISSKKISINLVKLLPYQISTAEISGQTAGHRFEQITKDFLENVFLHLHHVRPGKWKFTTQCSISDYYQYRHLNELAKIVKENKLLKTAFGDYVITPDIVVARYPVTDEEINAEEIIVDDSDYPRYTPLRNINNSTLILHASISCKWTIRSDRSQNSRTEGLNLIRNRKGNTPHIAVVTCEPTPGRISSLAFGTGDIDCVYHFALHELVTAVKQTEDTSALEILEMMIEGRRLRDISDLPFDLAV